MYYGGCGNGEFLVRYIRDRFVAQKRVIDLPTNIESNYVEVEKWFLVFALIVLAVIERVQFYLL